MCADLVTTLLLPTDKRNTVFAAVGPAGTNPSAYTPYGAQGAKGPVHNHLGFNGQLHERPAGWYHLGNGHRVYSPVLMRFHTPDTLSPFGKGGLNTYAYCVGDPVNLVDPTGQISIPEWLAPALTILTALGGATFSAGTLILPKIKPVTAPLQGRRLVASVMGVAGGASAVAGAGLLLAGKRDEAQIAGLAGALLNAPVAWTRLSALVTDKMRARRLAAPKISGTALPPVAVQAKEEGPLAVRSVVRQDRVDKASARLDRWDIRKRFNSV